ncbi:DUF6064 family protein [Roseovarius sp. D0-M9]|uniref:DUF6064 family protein n=1 Tax=Roseovarius sp. D0-M9 TaxID=3127117 RepID=UPI0030100A18
MREWLTYELSDLLLFSERVYWRLFELENAALWPVPLLAPLALLVALVLYSRRPRAGVRLICGLLALAWLSVGANFILQRYAPINWAMTYAGPVFGLQAIAFAALALWPSPGGAISRPAQAMGYGLLLAGALAYPALAPLHGRSIESAEVVGIAPDPTALASLGAAFFISGRWHRLAVLVVPCLWLGQSAATLYVLNGPAALAPAVGLLIGIAGLILFGKAPMGQRGPTSG